MGSRGGDRRRWIVKEEIGGGVGVKMGGGECL